jgi:tetratricopeptide (TPR) repeat protein
MALGLEDSAKVVLGYSAGSDLPTAQHYVDRGIIHAYFDQRDLAFADLNLAISINPRKPDFYVSRAKIFANANDFKSAIANLDSAIKLSPSNGGFFMSRGVLNYIAGESRNSSADFEIAQSLGEYDIPLPNNRNVSYFSYFGPNRFLVNTPEETGAAEYTDVRQPDAKVRWRLSHHMMAGVQREIEQYATTSNVALLEILLSRYLDLGYWVNGAETSTKLIELYPNAAEFYRSRGYAYIALNRHQEAITEFNRAVLLAPRISENLVARGMGYAEIGNYSLARADFDQAIQLDPVSSNAFKLRGFLSVQTGEPTKAFKDIDRAIEFSPFNHDAYLKRAQAYAAVGQFSLALQDMDWAIALAPINSEYLYQRGLVYFESAQYEMALADFDSAIVVKKYADFVDPTHANSFLERGRTNLRLGHLIAALYDAKSAIDILKEYFVSPEWDAYQTKINLQLADAHQLIGDVYVKLGRGTEEVE